MAGDFCSLIVALLLCLLWVIVLWDHGQHTQFDRSSATAIRQRLLKPRTPDDCPTCRCPQAKPAPAPPVKLIRFSRQAVTWVSSCDLFQNLTPPFKAQRRLIAEG